MVASPVLTYANGRQMSSDAKKTPLYRSKAFGQLQPALKKYVHMHAPYNKPRATARVPITLHSPHLSSTASSNVDMRAESDIEVDEREEADALNEIIMAFDMRNKGTVGCCYYVARDEKLTLIADIECGGLDIIDTREDCM